MKEDFPWRNVRRSSTKRLAWLQLTHLQLDFHVTFERMLLSLVLVPFCQFPSVAGLQYASSPGLHWNGIIRSNGQQRRHGKCPRPSDHCHRSTNQQPDDTKQMALLLPTQNTAIKCHAKRQTIAQSNLMRQSSIMPICVHPGCNMHTCRSGRLCISCIF